MTAPLSPSTLPNFPVTQHSVMLPQHFEAPPVNPSPNGLYAVTAWQDDPANRFFHGVEVRGPNYGGDGAFGVWAMPGCGLVLLVDVKGTGVDTTWTFTYGGQTTTALAGNADADEFEAAIVALSNVAPDDVTVVRPTPSGPFVVSLRERAAYSVAVTGANLTAEVEHVQKYGERPDILDPFEPVTVWAYDECDLTAPSRAEIEARAAQILRLEEQIAVEQDFANRMLTDAGTPHAAGSLRLALCHVEGVLAKTNTVGFIHVGAQWLATDPDLFVKSGTVRTTPSGHTWVIGGGYVDGLENTLVATSQPYGWRNEPGVYTAIDQKVNTFAAVAERTVLVGYEALIAAATVTP